MGNNNDNAMQALLKGVTYLIDKAIKSAPFDRTVNGIVVAINSNTVDIILNGIRYNKIATIMDLSMLHINDVVKITIPQNKMNDMFVIGKIR